MHRHNHELTLNPQTLPYVRFCANNEHMHPKKGILPKSVVIK